MRSGTQAVLPTKSLSYYSDYDYDYDYASTRYNVPLDSFYMFLPCTVALVSYLPQNRTAASACSCLGKQAVLQVETRLHSTLHYTLPEQICA